MIRKGTKVLYKIGRGRRVGKVVSLDGEGGVKVMTESGREITRRVDDLSPVSGASKARPVTPVAAAEYAEGSSSGWPRGE